MSACSMCCRGGTRKPGGIGSVGVGIATTGGGEGQEGTTFRNKGQPFVHLLQFPLALLMLMC